MIEIRRSDERGTARFSWLYSRHSFSFSHYYDPRHMGFGALRVLNEDTVQPGAGFASHPHRDMEILSYVLDGALEHCDSLGSGSVIRPGEVQRLSAGTGVRHSEFNPSSSEPVHFLQIWILPARRGLDPGYEQKALPEEQRRGRLQLIASSDGREESVRVHQDVDVYSTLLQPGDTVAHRPAAGRRVWVQVARGAVQLNGHTLGAGDGAALRGEPCVSLRGGADTEALLFDMA